MDDNESVSTQSTQQISLTSFLPTTTNDHQTGVSLSLRQTRQRMNTHENNSAWQSRTRYSTRSSASNRNYNEDHDNRLQQPSSSSRVLSASDYEDDDMSSNSKRNRIERSDRRIASINRPNYKIDSDDHEDDDDDDNDNDRQQKANKTNGTDDNQEDQEKTENNPDKSKGKYFCRNLFSYLIFSFQRNLTMKIMNHRYIMMKRKKMRKMKILMN